MKRWSIVVAAFGSVLAFASPGWGQDTDQTRFYIAIRLGAGILLNDRIVSGVEASTGQQLTGVSVGVNLGQHWGVELAGDGYEPDLSFKGYTTPTTPPMTRTGKFGEYAIYTILPQVRARYPLLDRRLTPYVLAGLGVSFAEFNDRKPPGFGVKIDAKGVSPAASLGAGIEYFVANNIAVGLETKYVLNRSQRFKIDGRDQKANLDSFLISFGLRVLFPEAKPGR